jgi:hypothetical protein
VRFGSTLYATGTILISRRLSDLLAPYSYMGPFSVDLYRSVSRMSFVILAHISKALRQIRFAMIMEDLGWCGLSTSNRDSPAIALAIERYVQFVQLLSKPELSRLTPSHDIDLIWHTHQLAGLKYRYVTF